MWLAAICLGYVLFRVLESLSERRAPKQTKEWEQQQIRIYGKIPDTYYKASDGSWRER